MDAREKIKLFDEMTNRILDRIERLCIRLMQPAPTRLEGEKKDVQHLVHWVGGKGLDLSCACGLPVSDAFEWMVNNKDRVTCPKCLAKLQPAPTHLMGLEDRAALCGVLRPDNPCGPFPFTTNIERVTCSSCKERWNKAHKILAAPTRTKGAEIAEKRILQVGQYGKSVSVGAYLFSGIDDERWANLVVDGLRLEVAALIDAAIAAETERCAKVAEAVRIGPHATAEYRSLVLAAIRAAAEG